MKQEKFSIMLCEIFNKRVALMFKKGDDYADEDILSNFKRMHALCEILDINTKRSPVDCAAFLEILKIDRKHNLRRKGVKPKNESVLDALLDQHNYADLMYANQIEQET